MKKTAYIIDAYSHGSYHEVINQGYLMMISELYEKVIYVADKSSCENLRILLDKCNFKYNNITFKEKRFSKIKLKSKGISYLLNILRVSFWNYYYYVKAPSCVDVFYNNNLFFAITLISLFSNKRNNIYDMCHNEMELIDSKSVYSSATSILSKYFRYVFCKIKLNRIFHFILLSPDMVYYFNSLISEKNHSRIFSIDHTYIRAELQYEVKMDNTDKHIRVGIPGAITQQRGGRQLKKILEGIKNDDICIYALSTCSENIENEHFVKLNKDNSLMPFEQYSNYVKSMDMMLLLYDVDSYKLTASGAVLEAIWNEKPVVALSNMYFSYLFNKFGQLGELASDVESLIGILNNIHDMDYFDCHYKVNLKNARNKLLPENTCAQLREIIGFDN